MLKIVRYPPQKIQSSHLKEGLKSDPTNYRLFSVLPVVSKLLERVVFNQLYQYLNGNNLLTDSPSGFRP